MIGASYGSLGEPQLALDHFEQALPLWRAVGDRRNEVTVLNNMGSVYALLGERQKALHYFDQCSRWRARERIIGWRPWCSATWDTYTTFWASRESSRIPGPGARRGAGQ